LRVTVQSAARNDPLAYHLQYFSPQSQRWGYAYQITRANGRWEAYPAPTRWSN